MNEQFELITVTISLAAAEMNENNCRTAIGKPAFSGVMQSMSRHVILPRTFGKKGRNSSGPARGVVGYQYTRYFAPKIPIYLKIVKCVILNT